MPTHTFFFSYASEDRSPPLKEFFNDLCEAIAARKGLVPTDEKVAFRDKNNLRLADTYKPLLLDALQNSSVLVSITSPSYFKKDFCGKEYYIFEQRRNINVVPPQVPPPVIFPIIWVPVENGGPSFVHDLTEDNDNIPPLYRQKGLRYLYMTQKDQYLKCVEEFADEIYKRAKEYPNLPKVPVDSFDHVPNIFTDSPWEEAYGLGGWKRGPEVANFVFAAAQETDLPEWVGRYGKSASRWRPFLPPNKKTVAEVAMDCASRHSIAYREIPVNDALEQELNRARERKNLAVVLVDPKSLAFDPVSKVTVFDDISWDGAFLIVPWDGTLGDWDDKTVKPVIDEKFPVLSKLSKPDFHAPIKTVDDLVRILDVTLPELRAKFTQVETARKPQTDAPPSHITSTVGATV